MYYSYPGAWLVARDQSTLVYPICPSFQDWQFPHELVPDQWLSAYVCDSPQILNKPCTYYPRRAEIYAARVPTPSQYSAAVLLREGSCRITNFDDCTETAHIIPKRENALVHPPPPQPHSDPLVDNANTTARAQFTRNEMEVYNRDTKLPASLITSDIENLLCLRTDIHMHLGAGNVGLVPKAGGPRGATPSCALRTWIRMFPKMEKDLHHLFDSFFWSVNSLCRFSLMASLSVNCG